MKPIAKPGTRVPWARPLKLIRIIASNIGVASMLICAVCATAQTTSTIQGSVTDKQGRAINGAELHVSSSTLATDHVVTSDDSGNYQFSAVPPGVYSLNVSHAGFTTSVFNNLDVT